MNRECSISATVLANKAIFLIITSLALFDCSSKKESIPIIHLHNTNRTKIVNLTEMLRDIDVIRLETSNGILLGQNTRYLVSGKYVVTIDNDKILQFSRNGKFIKTLITAGRGPDEFTRAEVLALDGKNDILFLNHRGDSKHIIVFDLKTGDRINRISTGIENLISKIIVLKDTILVIVPRMNKEYNFYYLSTSGKILNGIAPPSVKGIGLQTSLEKVLSNLYYMPKEYDTLYLINNTTKKPYCVFNVEDRFSFDNHEIGNFVYLSVNAPNFMIANKAHAKITMNPDGETYTMSGDKVTRYWIDKKDFSVSEITGFHNDYFGMDETLDPFQNYLSVCNDLGFIKFSAFELKQLIKKTLDSAPLDNAVKHRILILDELIKENDNPILLIGKMKTD